MQVIKRSPRPLLDKTYINMKYVSALLLAGALSLSAHAQNGLYVAPSFGAGISGSTHKFSDFEGKSRKQSLFSYNAQLAIGYKHDRWSLQTGISYFKSGYKLNNLTFGSDFNPDGPTASRNYTMELNQLGIPLQLGYSIPLGKRLSITPTAGLLASYALSGHSEIEDMGRTNLSDIGWSGKGRFGLWGTLGVQLEYKLSDRFSLIGGPSLQYKLAGGEKNLYNVQFHVGLKIKL